MIKVGLELGGKDATYVCEDVNVKGKTRRMLVHFLILVAFFPSVLNCIFVHCCLVSAAAESLADGAMYNCGQSCCSVERIYVQKEV